MHEVWMSYLYSMILVSSVWIILCIVLTTAYSTLSESYMMATVQRRMGPDYLLFGLVQPLVDGMKLMTKNFTSIYRVWDSMYYIFVGLLLTLGIAVWVLLVYDQWSYLSTVDYSVLFILIMTAMSVYTMVLSGLSGCCSYSILGTFRFILQLMSYEMNFSVIMLLIFGYYLGFHAATVSSVAYHHTPLILYAWLLVYLIVLGMMETARVPFDLPESESELVSGYNTEYGSFLFALLFLGEYSSMIIFAGLMLLFVGGSIPILSKLLLVSVITTMIMSSRCLYARLRYYDVVMLGWVHLLWLSLAMLTLLLLGMLL